MTFDELNNQKNELTKKIVELRDEMKKRAGDYLVELYKPLFDKYPEVYGITWCQYTPFFNDGEECMFASHHEDFSIILKDEDGYPEDVSSIWGSSDDVSDEMDKEFHDIFPALEDEDMLCFFGDHARVTLTRDGFEVDEFDHD